MNPNKFQVNTKGNHCIIISDTHIWEEKIDPQNKVNKLNEIAIEAIKSLKIVGQSSSAYGIQAGANYQIVVHGNKSHIHLTWRSFMGVGGAAAIEHFQTISQFFNSYICPIVAQNMVSSLKNGATINIGNFTLNHNRIEKKRFLLSNKYLRMSKVKTSVRNGDINFYEKGYNENYLWGSIELREENAILLPFLIDILRR